MTRLKPAGYQPRPAAAAVYDQLYGIYKELHDAFGGVANARPDLASIMKRLLVIKERASITGASA
jgi:L-ribulokinase